MAWAAARTAWRAAGPEPLTAAAAGGRKESGQAGGRTHPVERVSRESNPNASGAAREYWDAPVRLARPVLPGRQCARPLDAGAAKLPQVVLEPRVVLERQVAEPGKREPHVPGEARAAPQPAGLPRPPEEDESAPASCAERRVFRSGKLGPPDTARGSMAQRTERLVPLRARVRSP